MQREFVRRRGVLIMRGFRLSCRSVHDLVGVHHGKRVEYNVVADFLGLY